MNPTRTTAWKQLQEHYKDTKDIHLKALFSDNPKRGEEFTIQFNDLYVDYSKNRIDHKTVDLLVELANEIGLKKAIDAYFDGGVINATENRAVQHMALRDNKKDKIIINNENLKPEIDAVKLKIKDFCQKIINGSHKGYSGKAIQNVVNIGIGGSDLGPVMVTEALSFYKNYLKVHYLSNVDGDHIFEKLKDLDPETTLFIVVSKTFTTQETISNANTAVSYTHLTLPTTPYV